MQLKPLEKIQFLQSCSQHYYFQKIICIWFTFQMALSNKIFDVLGMDTKWILIVLTFR